MAVISLAHELHYYETMSGSDAFTVIIRGVAFLDFELNKLLEMIVTQPAELKDLKLDYNKRCNLAFALGLNRDLKPALSTVGNLRNKLAHDPARNLTEEDAANLHNALTASDRAQIPELLAKRVVSPKVSRFEDLSTMDKYVLMLVMLRSAIVAAQRLAYDQK